MVNTNGDSASDGDEDEIVDDNMDGEDMIVISKMLKMTPMLKMMIMILTTMMKMMIMSLTTMMMAKTIMLMGSEDSAGMAMIILMRK